MTDNTIYLFMILAGFVGMIDPRSLCIMTFMVGLICYFAGVPLR